jgi:hypothetical protein
MRAARRRSSGGRGRPTREARTGRQEAGPAERRRRGTEEREKGPDQRRGPSSPPGCPWPGVDHVGQHTERLGGAMGRLTEKS